MRLLQYDDVGRVSFTKDLSEAELPNYRYAILSHTWGADEEEVTYDDVVNETGTTKPGVGSEKIRFCIEQTRQEGLQYFWVDTCCIDKKNLVELSRALISMFRWYSNATTCYAFLSDVTYLHPKSGKEQRSKSWEDDFRSSRWFTRGWTLQELLAPRSLDFFSGDRYKLGTKASLGQVISDITRIPVGALNSQPLASFTIPERLRWQENRQTKEEEDIVYSLLGIFNVAMPVLYGEGKAQAQARLSALLEQPEKSPEPISNVPFRRDPHFIERTTLTDQIHAQLAEPAGRAALVGLGGVGKSQLAIEFARQVRQQSPQTWVLWIHASSAARFEQSVRDIADRLKIAGRNDPKADFLKLLHNWLCDTSKGRWLVVLDNADDATFLLKTPAIVDEAQITKRRVDYIPLCEHGSVLITTRSKSEALKLVYDSEIVDVLPMSEEEAESLLRSKLRQQSGEDRTLVRALDCVPLAIAQAGAYIQERGSRYSVLQYCTEIEQNHTLRTSLLRRHISLPCRDIEANNAVMLTWQISFEHIHHTQRSAADLLSLMSFCDRLAIPEILLRTDIGETASSSTFEDDIVILRSFSFVSETKDLRGWEMHRLVQDATQVWLEEQGRYDEVLGRFVYCLSSVFPTGRFENWSLCRTLFPHAIKVAEHKPLGGHSQGKWASVMYNGAWFAREQGDYNKALYMAMISMATRTEQLGKEDEATLWSVAMVASTLWNQGRWEEAEQLDVKVMETRRAKLGADHPDTLTSMANLASTYQKQGRWEEATQLFIKVMETRRTKLGVDHPDTLSGMANLAATYRNQGRWDEAEQLFVKVMEARTKLGADHPSMLSSMANLAATYRKQGRWEEAEQLEIKVMETRRTKLGADHPSTLSGMANLAATYRNQGRWEEAEQLFVKVMETRTKLGANYPDTLTSMANLAATYRKQGRWEEAEQLEVKVMETRRTKLGAGHPSTLSSMANLAATYRKQGRWEEAEQLEVKVMETRRTKLGADHPDTLSSIANLAATYQKQGRWEEAEQLEVKVVETRRTKLGADHPDTLSSIANLASTFWKQGRWEEAEQLDVKLIETRRTKLGADHPSTLSSMANLASTYWKQGRWEEAEQLDVKVVETRRMKLGADHPDTLSSMANLASTYRKQGRWDEAEVLEVKVMETRRMKLGADHPSTLSSMANLASTYWKQGRWEEAEQLDVKVVETRRMKLGADHPDTLSSMANLASTYRKQGRWEEAEQLEVEVIEIKRKEDEAQSRPSLNAKQHGEPHIDLLPLRPPGRS